MVIHHPKTPLEAVMLKKEKEDALYLAGGTEDLRLNGPMGENTELIDINGLVPSTIEKGEDGKLKIGALVTLQELVESDLVPEYLKSACRFCASFEKRNAATIGGNVGARRDDSYLIAALAAAGVSFMSITPHGEELKKVSEYANSDCKRLIEYFIIDPATKGYVHRFGITANTHAAVIAAKVGDSYALSVKGSALVCGDTPDIYKKVEYKDTLEGSAEYKKYLASTVFTLKEAK
ncbi:MAG: FAD binding domain-containing protein [Sphaerochaetaceae bacterium]|nr:FAD binding domain-containing protein [Sphaerochaetaceae bacterium]